MKSFVKHASIYGLASLLVRVGQFLLLPLYLRCLAPAEYGLLELITRFAETAGVVLLFGGFRQALMAHYQQASDDLARKRVVASALLLYAGAALAGGLVAVVLAEPVCSRVLPSLGERAAGLTPTLLLLGLLAMLVEPFLFVPQTLLQARTESRQFLVSQLGHFLFRVVLCIVFVRYYGMGVSGVLIATLISGGVVGIALTVREVRQGLAWPTRSMVGGLLTFALPLVPGGLCFFLLHQGDRLFLVEHATASEIGTYALGYNLALVVGRFAFAPLYMVWSARMYEVARQPDAAEVFGNTFARMLGIHGLAGLGLCLIAPEVVVLLGGESYAPAARYTAPIVLACVFQSAATLFDAGFYVQRRTARKLPLTLIATLIMLGLYAWLIPVHGTMGAACATLGGFAVLALLTYLATRDLVRVHLPLGRLSGMLTLGVGVWLVGQLIPAGNWGFAARIALGCLAPVLAWATGVISPEEKRDLHALFVTCRQRLLPVRGVVPAVGEPAGTPLSPSSTLPSPAPQMTLEVTQG